MTEPTPLFAERLRQSLRLPLQRLRKGVRPAGLFVAGVAVAFMAILLYNHFFPGPHQITNDEVNTSIAAAIASVTPAPAFSESVYKQVQPSLVLIQAQSTDAQGKTENGLGSGVIISDQGDILTALHVVTGSTEIQLTYADGSQSAAIISSSQPDHDIAVLKAASLPNPVVPATMGNPKAMQVGDEAFAVGNPFGLYSSMSSGVISGFGREIQPLGSAYKLTDLIQIDAAVNPGNSGGPLLNRYGEVIGIVTGLVNPTDQNFFVGIGFAIPITTAASGAGAPQY